MDYIYGKLNFEVKKGQYEGTTTETATTVVTSDEISVDVLKMPNALTVIDNFDESEIVFDGGSEKEIRISSYSILKELVPAEENQAEYSLTRDGEPVGDKIIFSKTVLNVSWTDLKTLRDSSQLVPGQFYRLTDYQCTTTQDRTRVAPNHLDFDIIIQALSPNKLSENCHACTPSKVVDGYIHIPGIPERLYYRRASENFPLAVSREGENLSYVGEYTYNGVTYGQWAKHEIPWGGNPEDDNGTTFLGNAKIINGELNLPLNEIQFFYAVTIDSEDVEIFHDSHFIGGNHLLIQGFGEILKPYYVKPEAWTLKYTIDNDDSRFAWADTVNGKGVIYRMIDEWGNDVPFDFKNIKFKRKITDGALDLVDGVDTWVYTFNAYNEDDSDILDGSLLNGLYQLDDADIICKNNMIKSYNQEGQYRGLIRKQELNDTVFLNMCSFDGGSYFENYANTFGNSCYSNTFGNNCHSSTFGNNCYYNTFGNSCYSNTFGNSCYSNTFSYNCHSNTFGNSCYSNTFGNSVYSNTFGNSCYSNTFGNSVYYNTFGNYVSGNSFGNYVHSNTFGNNVSNNSFGNYFMYSTVKNGVQFVRTPDSAYPNYFQYVTLENGLAGASEANRLNLEGIQAVVGYDTPIKVARGEGTEIVAVWQNGKALAGLRKATPTTADWTDIPDILDGGEY